MTSFPDLLRQGAAHAWLFAPTAILLGALHGLEPGHSKTMMAAFIVAVRGTVAQAVLLGLSAALSHTAVVWLVAIGGQLLGRAVDVEAIEAPFQLASAAVVAGIAAWMMLRTWRDRHPEAHRHPDGHDHGHAHHHHDDHPGHRHHRHGHGDAAEQAGVAAIEVGPHADAHERAHAADIARRFAGRSVTTGQIVMFGLTGGLIPCPAAITVLLLCLQLQEVSLGIALVLCFSVGLAATMVAAGVVAALGVRHVGSRWSGFGALAERAPYASGALMLIVALYMAWSGWAGLRRDEARAASAPAIELSSTRG